MIKTYLCNETPLSGFFSILKYQVSTLVYNNFVFVLDFYISDYVRFHPAYSVEFRRKKNSK